MPEATDYIDMSFSVNDAAPTAPNFGALLMAGESADGPTGAQLYPNTPGGIAEFVDAGGLVTDTIYSMLAQATRPTPRVSEINYWNTLSAPTESTAITPLGPFDVGKKYKYSFNGVVCEYACLEGDGAADVAAALEALADAVPGVVGTYVALATSFSVAPDTGFNHVAHGPYRAKDFTVVVTQTHATPIVDALNAAADAIPNFYGVLVDAQDDTTIAAVAAWVETNRKLCLLRTKQSSVLSGGGVLATLKAAGYHRTGLIYSEDDKARADVALLVRQLATDPGQSDFQFKDLPGVAVSDLTAAQNNGVKNGGGITFISVLGVRHTSNGLAVSGRPLAVTRNLDWLEARINQLLFSVFVNNEIVNIDEEGIAKFETELNAAFIEAEQAKVVNKGWKVIAPALASLQAVDTNAGLIKGFTFEATTGKAARKVQIRGYFK